MPKHKILVAEDEAIVARDIQSRLRFLGYSAVAAATAEEVIAIAKRISPDLVLMDIKLKGDRDGIDAARELRQRFNIPVVYLTAYADEKTVARAKLTEPFGYIIKPFNDRELQTRIEVALHNHEMETKLRESEAWCRAVLRHISDAVIATDSRYMINFMNPVAEALLGMSSGEAEGKPVLEVLKLMTHDTRKPVSLNLPKVLGHSRSTPSLGHLILVGRNGVETHVDQSSSVMCTDCGKAVGLVLILHDLTQQNLMNMRLLSKHKVEAAGILARGIAHDFGNIMGVITGYASSMADNLIPKTKAHEDALRILDAAKHARNLTERLLKLARASEPDRIEQLAPVSLAEAVTDTAKLLHDTFTEAKTVLTIRNAQDMPFVSADASGLLDALMNILLNSVESMHAGGAITVDATVRKITAPPKALNPKAKPGNYVVLRVKDTGAGMNDEVRKRIFEPFFTTRESRSAMGLGLTVTLNTVLSWGGWIRTESEPGKGTTCFLYMPQAKTEPRRRLRRAAGGQTILIIDDNREQLKTIADILHGAGYTVLQGLGANEGLALYSRHARNISIYIIDLVMPDRDGNDVFHEIVRNDPEASIVITSGFSRDYVRRSLGIGGWSFLQKPIEKEPLLAIVSRLLEQRLSK